MAPASEPIALKPALVVATLLTLSFWGTGWVAADSPVRYALIIGNNEGHAPAGMALDRLRRSEREARRLRDALVSTGAFPDSDRVIVLTGKGRAAIMAAARRLAEQHRTDRQRWGNLPTLFAFFFTGHGLEKQLLTTDDPLTSDDLARIFRDMGQASPSPCSTLASAAASTCTRCVPRVCGCCPGSTLSTSCHEKS